ncbi:MAG TPA: DUF4238 domain-containing protein [Ignavibacteria bacterium]|nr:DUF4238 domain-containing protein [Ignavibacteria bacterium]
MSKPVQHHYLPKNAYLKFFESSEKADFVWMHQRNKEPIFVNFHNAAKERHLYSFTDEHGQYNTELESALAEMESVASKIFEKLNRAEGSITISAQEKSELSYFLAMQTARTPAFRDSLKQRAAEFVKLHMQMLASNKNAFNNVLREVKKEKPHMPDVSFEEMKKFIFDEKYTIKMGNENYFLKQAIQLGDHIYPSIMTKDMFILKSKSVELITSDYPVNLIPDPGMPAFYGGGFFMSGILVPIGTHTALFCKNPSDSKEPPKRDEQISMGYKEVPFAHARWINKVTINYAERFLFSASLNLKIKELFDKTTVPKRFHMSSPFSHKNEQLLKLNPKKNGEARKKRGGVKIVPEARKKKPKKLVFPQFCG